MSELITRRAALGSLAACACCAAGLPGRAAESHGGAAPYWGYDGAGAPEHWGELSADFKTCQLGMEQTPIDLDKGVRAKVGKPLTIAYKPVGGKIVNNGHTIQVNVDKGCSCTIEGTTYELLQFHFHHPSEHLVSGKPYSMELHLVHKAGTGSLAVIGVFLREGQPNAVLAPVFDNMPKEADESEALARPLDPSGLLPKSRSFYRYMGSLTTPPCSEGLTWSVFKEPIEASPEQIRKFAALFPNNARPVQPRNNRVIFEADETGS